MGGEMTTAEKKMKNYSWFRHPQREDFKSDLPAWARHLSLMGTSVNSKNPGQGVAKAVDSNTRKLEDLIYEYRYQSACSDWKANIAIAIAIVSVVCSILTGVVSCAIAHNDSEQTTRAIVSAISTLKCQMK